MGWGDFVKPGGDANKFFDPLDLFGGAAGAQAGKAGEAQAAAQIESAEFLKDQYETLKGLEQPFIEGGQQAFGMQAALSGLSGPEAQQEAMNQFNQYQQGAIDYGADVNYTGMPSGISDALRQYTAGVAGQDYDNYYNRLAGVAGMGQSSASALGGVTVDQSRGIADTIQRAGDARANSALMQGQIQNQAIGNISKLGGAFIEGMGNRSGNNQQQRSPTESSILTSGALSRY